MKVLHFSHKPAFPMRDGGCVAIGSLLKSLLLDRDFEVHHLTLSTHKHPFDKESYPLSWRHKMTLNNCKINTRTDLIGAIYYLIKGESYNLARFKQKKLRKKLEDLLSRKSFDIVIFESIYTLPYLDLFLSQDCKLILRAHNVEHEIWQQLSGQSSFFLKKWYYKKLAQQLKRFESTVLKKLDGIIAISEDDALFFQQFAPQVHLTALPTSVKTNFPDPDYTLTSFYFLGAMDWQPNQEGIDWLLNKVIPDGLKGLSLHIAGKSLKQNEIDHPSVECHGEIESALTFIQEHGICLIPMLSGSGIKIKLLENMAMGKPIITTKEGTRGVEVTHGKEVLIADTPEEFRKAMYSLAMDEEQRERLGRNAKQFVINNFGEEKITRRLSAFIKEA